MRRKRQKQTILQKLAHQDFCSVLFIKHGLYGNSSLNIKTICDSHVTSSYFHFEAYLIQIEICSCNRDVKMLTRYKLQPIWGHPTLSCGDGVIHICYIRCILKCCCDVSFAFHSMGFTREWDHGFQRRLRSFWERRKPHW